MMKVENDIIGIIRIVFRGGSPWSAMQRVGSDPAAASRHPIQRGTILPEILRVRHWFGVPPLLMSIHSNRFGHSCGSLWGQSLSSLSGRFLFSASQRGISFPCRFSEITAVCKSRYRRSWGIDRCAARKDKMSTDSLLSAVSFKRIHHTRLRFSGKRTIFSIKTHCCIAIQSVDEAGICLRHIPASTIFSLSDFFYRSDYLSLHLNRLLLFLRLTFFCKLKFPFLSGYYKFEEGLSFPRWPDGLLPW